MTKLQIALTDQEAANLNLQAFKMGYSLTRFVKFLIGQVAFKAVENIPVYPMSPKLLKISEAAWQEHQAGKTIKVNSVADYLKQQDGNWIRLKSQSEVD